MKVPQQLGYLNRDLGIIDDYERRYPGCLQKLLGRKQKLMQVIRTLYFQQAFMYRSGIHKIAGRIASISQDWVRPIARQKQTADVEFGAKVAMSMVDGLRICDGMPTTRALRSSSQWKRTGKRMDNTRPGFWRTRSSISERT